MEWAKKTAGRPVVCGHRGAPAFVAENTIASFDKSIALGAPWVELDVRPTADERLAIHHDADTAAGQHIASVNFDALDASIPEFADLLDGRPELGLDIEMKTNGIDMSLGEFAELVIAAIEDHRPSRSDLIVTSFDADALVEVRNRRPEVPTGLLFRDPAHERAIARAVEDGHVAIAPRIHLLSEDLVERARAASLDIVTWTVNQPEQVRLAAKLGVDMIIGDDPGLIIEHL